MNCFTVVKNACVFVFTKLLALKRKLRWRLVLLNRQKVDGENGGVGSGVWVCWDVQVKVGIDGECSNVWSSSGHDGEWGIVECIASK